MSVDKTTLERELSEKKCKKALSVVFTRIRRAIGEEGERNRRDYVKWRGADKWLSALIIVFNGEVGPCLPNGFCQEQDIKE